MHEVSEVRANLNTSRFKYLKKMVPCLLLARPLKYFEYLNLRFKNLLINIFYSKNVGYRPFETSVLSNSRIWVYYSFSVGLFIFLSFAASGKALELYKSKLHGILRNCKTTNEGNNRRNYNCNQTDGNVSAQDTRL